MTSGAGLAVRGGRVTRLPVEQASESVPLEPDHVYLIPPRKEMIVSGGLLLLTDKDPANPLSRPIDHFFRSMAQEAGGQAIAVVLSGTGTSRHADVGSGRGLHFPGETSPRR